MIKKRVILLGLLFLSVALISMVPAAPLCFSVDDMPSAGDRPSPCLGMDEVVDGLDTYCCYGSGAFNTDYVCPTGSVNLTEEGDSCSQFGFSYFFYDYGEICCSECIPTGGINCLDDQGNQCYGGFSIDVSSNPEVCNDLDDNCNGIVDEGNVCDTSPYGGYGYVSYCEYEFPAIDLSGEEYCNAFTNQFECETSGNQPFSVDACEWSGSICSFNSAISCDIQTSQSSCLAIEDPNLAGNYFCAWTDNEYTEEYSTNGHCDESDWNVDPLCIWNPYHCDLNDICCIEDGYDHIIAPVGYVGTCTQDTTPIGTDCYNGDVYNYNTDTFCDGANSDACNNQVRGWTTIAEDCGGAGCTDGACIVPLVSELLWMDIPEENNLTETTISVRPTQMPYSVKVIYNNSGLSSGVFSVKEKDAIGGDDDIVTLTASLDGTQLEAIFEINDTTLAAAGTELSGIYKFYFEIDGLTSGILYIDTNELSSAIWTSTSNYDPLIGTINRNLDDVLALGIPLRMYYSLDSGTTFDLSGNNKAIGSFDAVDTGSEREYNWTMTCEDLQKTGEVNDFELEFAIDGTNSEKLTVHLDGGDLPIECNPEIIYFDVNVCGDYETPASCNADPKEVAAEGTKCAWVGNECGTQTVIKYDGENIGNCTYFENTATDTCDDGFLTYDWTADWQWSSLDYDDKDTCETANGVGTCVQYPLDSQWYYDPQGASIECADGSATIACPAQVQLDFFNAKNLIAAVLLIAVIYLIIKNFKKQPVKKKPTKKKAVKKKVSKKKK